MKPTAFALTLIAASLATAGTTLAATYDLKAQWSRTANPNGPWTLEQGGVALPRVADWTPISNTEPAYNPATGHIKQPAFAPSATAGDFLPAWFKSAVTTASITPGWVKGDVIVHTTDTFNGPRSGVASVVFTNPVATIATISGYVYNARDLNRPQAWSLSVNDAVRASGSLPGDGSVTRATKKTFKVTNVALQAGDTVRLTLSEAGGPSGPGDFIGCDLKVVAP